MSRLPQEPHEGALLLFVTCFSYSGVQGCAALQGTLFLFFPLFHPISEIVYFTALCNEVMKWWSQKSLMCHYASTVTRPSYASLLPLRCSSAHKTFCCAEYMGYTQTHHWWDLVHGQIELLGSTKEKQNSLFWVTSEVGAELLQYLRRGTTPKEQGVGVNIPPWNLFFYQATYYTASS